MQGKESIVQLEPPLIELFQFHSDARESKDLGIKSSAGYTVSIPF